MSELRPDSPVRRPPTARRREPPVPAVEPPTPAELEAIERHLVSLPALEGATVTDDEVIGMLLVRGPGRGPDATYAAMPRWADGAWHEGLERVRRRMRELGAWPSLLLTDRLAQPSGLQPELERLGWLPVTGETVLWVGHAAAVPHLDAGLRIEAVRPGSLDVHEALERRIFGIGAEGAPRRRAALAAALEAGIARAWVVRRAGQPVAVARLAQGDGSAALQGIGVLPEQRGQGYGTLITTVATRAALASGNRLVWLSVSEDNLRAVGVYSRLGYRRAFSWRRWLVSEDPRRL